jgi:hypothetical protein
MDAPPPLPRTESAVARDLRSLAREFVAAGVPYAVAMRHVSDALRNAYGAAAEVAPHEYDALRSPSGRRNAEVIEVLVARGLAANVYGRPLAPDERPLRVTFDQTTARRADTLYVASMTAADVEAQLLRRVFLNATARNLGFDVGAVTAVTEDAVRVDLHQLKVGQTPIGMGEHDRSSSMRTVVESMERAREHLAEVVEEQCDGRVFEATCYLDTVRPVRAEARAFAAERGLVVREHADLWTGGYWPDGVKTVLAALYTPPRASSFGRK